MMPEYEAGLLAGLKEAAKLASPFGALIHKRISELENTANPLTNQHISTEDNKPK